MQTYSLSQYFSAIVGKLLETTERSDANESNLRSGGYEALMAFLTNSPVDCYQCVQQTTMVILTRIQNALQLNPNQVRSHNHKHLRG